MSQRWSAVPDALCGTKGFWVRGIKKYCVILPQHTPLQPSTLHTQKQWLHCIEEVRILSFLLLQRHRLCSSSSRALQWGGEDFFQHKWPLLVGFGANSSIPTAGILPSQCCPAVTPEQKHHHLPQKKILNTRGVNKMRMPIQSYSEDGITKQLVSMSKWP